MADPHEHVTQASSTDDQLPPPTASVSERFGIDHLKAVDSLIRHHSSSHPEHPPGILWSQSPFLNPSLRSAHIFSPHGEDYQTERFDLLQTGFPGIFENSLHQYKSSIIQKYQSEWSFLSDERDSLNAPHTEPQIIEKNQNGTFKNITELFPIYCPVTVILQGDSGSGKSVIAQKMMLAWASETVSSAYFAVVFYLRCEELICITEEMNLTKLLSYSSSLTSDQISQILQRSPEYVLFIIDGFDELRLTQDIYDMSANTHPLHKAKSEVILCALLRRFLIPESKLLVTTRTKNTVNKLLNGIQSYYLIMGFSEKKVERLFRKEFDSVRENETVFTACSIPVIHWIVSEMFSIRADITRGLETTTSIYVDFVSTLLEHHCQGLSQSVPTLLMSLGQLAERGMQEQQVLLDEKTVYETVSDPANNPFLCKFLSKRTIHLETMFSFIHLSFQEFFTALYYVLLDEEKSQRKVRELLHTVERGLSCWSDEEFSMADVEVKRSELLQPVIEFLCGLCKNEWISSFFEKHNMAVLVKLETQLKEWISQCSQRYQNEHMLFILHCLYELHEKSFTGKVLEGLILINLSNTPLKRTDCWVLKYCLQCCEHIRNLKLYVTSDNLKMLEPELYRCKELRLKTDWIPENVGGLISVAAAAAGKEETLNKLNIKMSKNTPVIRQEVTVSVQDGDIKVSHNMPEITFVKDLTVTCANSLVSFMNWVLQENPLHKYGHLFSLKMQLGTWKILKSLSGLKKVRLYFEYTTEKIFTEIRSLIQACPSLVELSIQSNLTIVIEPLKESLKKMHWTLTVWGNSVLIKPDEKRFPEEQLMTRKEECEIKIAESSGSSSSLKTELSSAKSFLENAEMFTPELLQMGDEDKRKKTYRFACAHAGQFQCSLTSLVFVMEDEGEVLYRVVSWDPRLLDGLGHMQPAGPLYNIDCFKGSISRLHLPHCEILSEKNQDGLAVAHITGDNVEIMQPLGVTGSHVMVDIKHLSLFGLIKRFFSGPPIRAQVLLFLRPVTVEEEVKILHVHLLPGNVPVTEVQSFHQDKKYIETSSKCQLFPGREYILCCQPVECGVQPQSDIFESNNFGPNYHPMFEVFLGVRIKEISLDVLDKTEQSKAVWIRPRIFLTAPGEGVEALPQRRITESEFVRKHRDELIKRVSSVMPIADSLLTKNMITDELYSEVQASEPRRKKMRRIFDALGSGDHVRAEFYRLLKENEPHLVDELESGPSGS